MDLSRFLEAQDPVYATVVNELRRGEKRTHWMWYVFPQITGLGTSETARFYAIRDREEANAYLDQPVLGDRLRECFEIVLSLEDRSAHQIFGSPDDLKLRSCATLFAAISKPGSVFHQTIEKYFEGQGDSRTMKILN
jgi:uncharacterized protein (DUF1810 family)